MDFEIEDYSSGEDDEYFPAMDDDEWVDDDDDADADGGRFTREELIAAGIDPAVLAMDMDEDYDEDEDDVDDDIRFLDEQEEGDEDPMRSAEALHILASVSAGGGSILEQLRALATQGNFRAFPPEPEKQWSSPTVTPIEAGLALRYGGEFGSVRQRRGLGSGLIWERERSVRPVRKADYGREAIPNTHGTTVANLTSLPYCGQYSSDSSFFYTASQDCRMTFFSTSMSSISKRPPQGPRPVQRRRLGHFWGTGDDDDDGYSANGHFGESSLNVIKTFQGLEGGWTVTDADLGMNDEWMIYSSMMSHVQLFRTLDLSEEQTSLDFSSGGFSRNGRRYRTEDLKIWSVRFSADGKEIVAGATSYEGDGKIVVYDIEARRPTLSINAHENDVNSVCWADKGSKHLLCSGSDDGYLKVWDRRSLSSGKPSGVLNGHTEGITNVSSKGDGRYILSNGKDQALKMWDLRSMAPASICESVPDARRRWGTGYDYRSGTYPKPRHVKAPGDCSVMTYHGHQVTRTLIRCHFAPDNSTGASYVYSGSADGRIHIWNLDGTVTQVLDRKYTTPLVDFSRAGDDALYYSDPSAADPPSAGIRSEWRGGRGDYCVRDVSWHGYKPEIMSSAWEPSGRGSLAKHEWKGFGKHAMTIEDVLKREELEAAR